MFNISKIWTISPSLSPANSASDKDKAPPFRLEIEPSSSEFCGSATLGFCAPSADLSDQGNSKQSNDENSGKLLFNADAGASTGKNEKFQRQKMRTDEANPTMQKYPIVSSQNVSNLSLKVTPPRVIFDEGAAAAAAATGQLEIGLGVLIAIWTAIQIHKKPQLFCNRKLGFQIGKILTMPAMELRSMIIKIACQI
ncbi:hypothetical protein P3S68_017472 [Capsicum galapagoense]